MECNKIRNKKFSLDSNGSMSFGQYNGANGGGTVQHNMGALDMVVLLINGGTDTSITVGGGLM